MKKNVFIMMSLLMVMFAFSSISCRTPPPAIEDEQDEVCLEEINRLIAQVEEARKRAMDFESPAYFPSEWEAAEAQFAEAVNMPKTNEDEVQQAAELLRAVADAYDALFRKTIPLYAQAWEDEIMAARNALIGTGLRNAFPEPLRNADAIALTALEQYEAGDYYIARDTAAAALNEYETLLLGATAYLRRQEIVTRGFVRFVEDGLAEADEVAFAAIDKHEAGDTNAAREYASDALDRFNALLTSGWVYFAAERRTYATDEREAAISNRVNIAMREAFREADGVFNQAEQGFNAGNHEEAAILFTESEALFIIASQETEIRRQRAQEAIRLAEERIEESSETAIEAERIIGGYPR